MNRAAERVAVQHGVAPGSPLRGLQVNAKPFDRRRPAWKSSTVGGYVAQLSEFGLEKADDEDREGEAFQLAGRVSNRPMKRTKAEGLQVSVDGQPAGPRGRRTGPASAPRGPAVLQSANT